MFKEKLSEQVRQCPCLYDLNSPDYRSARIKKRIWRIIATKLNVDAAVCKTMWRSLRDRYMKEFDSLDLPSDSGVSAKKPWKYMEQLSFLKSSHASRSIGDDKVTQQCFENAVKEDSGPLRLPVLTVSPRSSVKTLPPSLSNANSGCTVIQDQAKSSSADNPFTERKNMEKNLSRFLNIASKSLQKTKMERSMLSMSADVQKLKWSLEKTFQFQAKVNQLLLEMHAESRN